MSRAVVGAVVGPWPYEKGADCSAPESIQLFGSAHCALGDFPNTA